MNLLATSLYQRDPLPDDRRERSAINTRFPARRRRPGPSPKGPSDARRLDAAEHLDKSAIAGIDSDGTHRENHALD